MSKNQYSFHSRQIRNINTNPLSMNDGDKTSAQSMGKVKKIILEQYDKFLNMKVLNEEIKYLSETREKLSKEILSTFSCLQKTESIEISRELNQKLNNLTTLDNKLKDEYRGLLKTELNILHDNWPDIFEKVIEGVDRETLEHVLTVFEEYQKGHLNDNQALSQGMDYMTLKYNLPKDFFDKSNIDQFNKNLHKSN